MADEKRKSTPQKRPYRMAARAEKAAETRARILDAVREMLSDGVFHDAPIDEVANRAGVTRVTVYRAFGSKRGLLEAVTWDSLGRARMDRVDAAHADPDVRTAVRRVLRENCHVFADLGDTMPHTLDLARRDPDVAAIIDGTYHGRRHLAMEELAARIHRERAHAAGWTKQRVADALLVLSSYEAFETLVHRRGHSPQAAGDILFGLATAFLAPEPD
jgi:AcrR family transcriptional regulator